ncbi:MAG: undecaprenyl-diphosphate phosphatase [Candidatus Binatia bacterium]
MVVWLKALVLGIVEGATEFLPVSSTGHLIIAADWLRFPEAQRDTFEIFIQLGAILAVFWHYRVDLVALARARAARRHRPGLAGKVLLAFLPAAAVGLLLHHWIAEHLFSVRAVAWALIGGGVVIWLVERRQRTPASSTSRPCAGATRCSSAAPRSRRSTPARRAPPPPSSAACSPA